MRTPDDVITSLAQRAVLPEDIATVARYMHAHLEGRVITEPDGRQWVFDPDCTHQPGIAFRDKFCGRCGMQLDGRRPA
jgi:hypothetical protein